MFYDSSATQPFTGRLPGLTAVGPSNLRYTSSTSPHFQAHLQESRGRQLAGLPGTRVADEQSVPAYATNELELLSEDDDAQGSGIFDPFATEPNIYPDAGVLASRYSLPGYLARERMYEPSEIVDATTGRPVTYVNGGAVALDTAAQIAAIERGAYRYPEPLLRASEAGSMPDEGTSLDMQAPMPIPGTSAEFAFAGLGAEPAGNGGSGMGRTTQLALAVAGGLAVGAAFGLLTRK